MADFSLRKQSICKFQIAYLDGLARDGGIPLGARNFGGPNCVNRYVVGRVRGLQLGATSARNRIAFGQSMIALAVVILESADSGGVAHDERRSGSTGSWNRAKRLR